MRLKVLFLSLCIFITIGLSAQYSGNQGRTLDFSGINFESMSVGIRLSPAISWVNINHNDAEAEGASLNYGLGAIVDYKINRLLSVVSGVNYQTFGGYAFDNASLNDYTTRDNFKLSYSEIEVPLGLKLQTPTLGVKSYYITGGITTGFILSATEKHISTIAKIKPTINDIFPLSSSVRTGCFVGLGTNYRIGRKIILFGEIVYKTGLSSVAIGSKYSEDINHKYSQDIEIRPSNMDFSIGLMF